MAETLSVREAASLLGLSRSSAYRAVKSGALPIMRLGGRLLVLRRPLERMLDGKVEDRRDEPEQEAGRG